MLMLDEGRILNVNIQNGEKKELQNF